MLKVFKHLAQHLSIWINIPSKSGRQRRFGNQNKCVAYLYIEAVLMVAQQSLLSILFGLWWETITDVQGISSCEKQ